MDSLAHRVGSRVDLNTTMTTLPTPSAHVDASAPGVWDRITTWASEHKAVVYSIAGVAVVVTGAGVVYYLSDSKKPSSAEGPRPSKKERRKAKKEKEKGREKDVEKGADGDAAGRESYAGEPRILSLMCNR